jgi:hypothetical protein
MDLKFPEVPARYGEDPKAPGREPEWDSRYEAAVRQWTTAAYEEADLDRRSNEELKRLGQFIDYIEGQMWKGNRASYKSKPVNPKVGDNFWELHGLLTDIKPIMDVKSGNGDKAYVEAAAVINKGIRAWAYKNRYNARLALNVCWGILTSSFCKWQWNPDLAHEEGDLEAKVYGPKDVLLLKPDVDDPVQSSLCLIGERPVSLSWLKKKYPTRGHLAVADMKYSAYTTPTQAPAHVNSLLWDVMSPAVKYKIGGQPETKASSFPMALHQEFWFPDYQTNVSNVTVTMGKGNWKYEVKPMGRLYPRGRVITKAGGHVMEDQCNPYWHGQKPFTMLRLNVVPWSVYGSSDVKNWIHLQDIMNQILAGVLDMIKRAVNPGFFAPRNAFTETVWASIDFAKPGEKAAYSPNAAHEPKFAPAPNLPGYVMQAYQIVERALEQMSGKSAANQMMGKKQIPGSDGIEAIQMMRTTPVRVKSRNIEGFIEDGGNLMVPNMIQFYTEKRRMSMMGRSGTTDADFDWDPGTIIPAGTPPQEFIRAFNYHVKPGSLLATEKRGKIMDALQLRKQGDLDRKTLFRIIDEEGLDVEEVEKNLKKEMQEKIAMMPQKGGKGKK